MSYRESQTEFSSTGSKEIQTNKPIDANRYDLSVSQELSDPHWDRFLNGIPGVYFAQSSLWAEAKASVGWRALRVVARQHGEIVGGAQMLTRPLSFIGKVGYVPRGPVLLSEDPKLADQIIAEIGRQAKRHRVQAVVLQPNQKDETIAKMLANRQFRPTAREVSPVFTLLLDLAPDLDAIMAQTKSQTRYNIRLSDRKGMAIREGTVADLPTFCALAQMTGERQDFIAPPADFFHRLWQLLEPAGHLKLFVAEYEGETIAAQLAIPFGDTVFNKLTVWSGAQGKRKPNESLLWGAIQWAKNRGYRYYDFGGLSIKGAANYLHGEPLPEKLKGTVTSFKLGFGGQIEMYPQARIFVTNWLARQADTRLLAKSEHSKFVKRVTNRMRN